MVLQPVLGNETDASVSRVSNAVGRANAPGFAEVGAAGEHAAIEVGLKADDSQHWVLAFEQRVPRHGLNGFPNLRQVSVRVYVIREGDPHRGASVVA